MREHLNTTHLGQLPNTRQDIIDAVRNQSCVIVWRTSQLCVIFAGFNESLAISFDDLTGEAKEAAAELGLPILVVDGIRGLAATDKNWDGKEFSECLHCGKIQPADERVAENLAARIGAKITQHQTWIH